ncbi:MAG: glycosyltransferase [Erysipelotrichales bacterium]|nr:glycosyltransferase [Erysipelotrichales bacterium]
MKKIVFVACVGGYSGAENLTLLIANELSKCGYLVIYASPRGVIEGYLSQYPNINYEPFEFNLFSLMNMLNKTRPDVVYTVDFKVSMLCSLLPFPIVTHLHNNPTWLQKKSIFTLLLLYSMNKAKANICVSDSIMDEFVFSKYVHTNTKTISNVVDEDKVITLANMPLDKKYDLCFIGRLTEQKDPLRFIRIVNKINQFQNNNVSAVMIGIDGGLQEECEILVKNNDLNIDIVGFQNNPYKFIANSRLTIMPSKWEGFGLTAVESMILGVPVLGTGVGGLRNVIGFVDRICVTDEEFVNLSCKLLNDDNLYSQTQIEVKNQARKFTSIKEYSKKIIQMIEG